MDANHPSAILFPGQGVGDASSRELVARLRPDLLELADELVGEDPFERMAAATGSGMRATKLAFAAAFHTEAMSPGVEAFRAELQEIDFQAPRAPVVSSTTAEFFDEDPRDALAASLVSPIRWTEVLGRLSG